MTDRSFSFPLTPETLQLAAHPHLLHRAAMRHLPDLGGMSSAIRADTGTLLRLDLPSDPLGIPGQLTLRLRGPVVPTNLEAVETLPLREGSRIVVRLAAEARRTDSGQRTQRPVGDQEFFAWATRLLIAGGLNPLELHFSRSKQFGASNSAHEVRFVIRDVAATISLSDPELAQQTFERGLGRGKAYGLGMIVVTSNDNQRVEKS